MSKSNKGPANISSISLSECDEPLYTSYFFGFTPIKPPRISKDDEKLDEKFLEEIPKCADRSAVLRTYFSHDMFTLPHPVMLSFKGPILGGAKKSGLLEYNLEIIGLHGAIAEAIAVRTAASILEDEGYENIELVLNSVGDKESVSEFERNLQNWARKHVEEMPVEVRKAIKESVWNIFVSTDPKFERWKDSAPKPMNFLSEVAREHFKGVLEHVEALGFPYRIDYHMVANPECASHTIFRMVTEEGGKEITLATGFRYGKLSKRVGLRKEIPALGVRLSYKPNKAKNKVLKISPRQKFYLVQIGFAAKLKILNIIESLRKARIPVAHSVAKDKLTSQMSSAENMKITHVLIVGQKEAIEDAVTVRDMISREQVTVSISDLAIYLKKLR